MTNAIDRFSLSNFMLSHPDFELPDVEPEFEREWIRDNATGTIFSDYEDEIIAAWDVWPGNLCRSKNIPDWFMVEWAENNWEDLGLDKKYEDDILEDWAEYLWGNWHEARLKYKF